MRIATSNLEVVTFVDPAGGKTARVGNNKGCKSAIVTVGRDWLGHIFVLEPWGDRCSTDTLIERIFQVNERWKPRVLGIEANAMQALFAESVSREARFKKVRIPLQPIKQPTNVSKEWRIRACLQPVLAAGCLVLGDDQVELKEEIRTFPMSMTVDVIDALASAVMMLPSRLRSQARTEEEDAYAAYLRKVGAPPAYIERKLRELTLAQKGATLRGKED